MRLCYHRLMLMSIPTQLPDDVAALKEIIQTLQSQLRIQEEKLSWFNSKFFGRKSEKLTPEDVRQGLLFNEAEAGAVEAGPEPEKTTIVAGHARKKPGRKKLPSWLPRIEVVHDLAPDEKQCACGVEMKKIGEETSEKLDVIPAKFQVIRNIRNKYACPSCEGTSTEETGGAVKIAPLPPSIIPKGIATPGLIATVLIGKFCDGLPFYRQTSMFSRGDIDIPRATMCNWAIKIYNDYTAYFELMFDELLGCPVIGVDETTVQVMNEEGRKNTDKSYMWVFRGGGTGRPTIIFDYHPTRSARAVLGFLNDYGGIIQSDGFSSYDAALSSWKCVHAGCMAHVRRKFFDAAKHGKDGSDANTAISFIRQLYAVEEKARALEMPADVMKLREEKAKPVLDAFKDWLDRRVHHVVPGGHLGKAIGYALREWPKLLVYLTDGRASIDNNLVENAIRPFVIGRKNWLFSGSPDGARASAAFYSIIETAKANGLNSYWFLRHLFEHLPLARGIDEMRELLPQRIDPAKIVKA